MSVQYYGPKTVAVLAYTAGVIDSDGCIGLTLSKSGIYRININVSDASGKITAWLKEQWGGTVGTYFASYAAHTNQALISTWYISSSARAIKFLELILPYLILKREQAELMTKFPLLVRGRKSDIHTRAVREVLWLQMRDLNSRYSSRGRK